MPLSRPPVVESLPLELDQYTLVERLATGGMADVYLAVERRPLGGPRWVAIKRIRADYVDHPEFIEYFVTEGRVSLACHHPNIPYAYHLGAAGGRPYLALEYVAGPTLLAAQRAAARRRRPIALGAAMAIALAAARALDHLHTLCDVDGRPLNAIHRDVTPQNLLVAPGGVVKLIDLGVVRASLQTHRTAVGVIKGKYAYIAPEQLERERPVDQRADLFSWGTVVHELLTGEPLFHGTSELDTCERVRSQTIPDPSAVRPEVPAALAEVVLTALAREPDRRWPSAASIVDALEHAATVANIYPWPSRLAREIGSLCGTPRTPQLSGQQVVWKEGEAPPEATATEEETTPIIQVRGEDGSWEAEPKVQNDPQLSYFLKAGAVDKPWQGGDSTDVTKS